MAKKLDDSVYDAALSLVSTSTRVSVCTAEPANFAGIAAVSTGSAVLVGGDFTISDGVTSGRRVTVAEKTYTPASAGTVNHWAYDDGVTLLAVTTCTSKAVSIGVDETLTTIDIELADPT